MRDLGGDAAGVPWRDHGGYGEALCRAAGYIGGGWGWGRSISDILRAERLR